MWSALLTTITALVMTMGAAHAHGDKPKTEAKDEKQPPAHAKKSAHDDKAKEQL